MESSREAMSREEPPPSKKRVAPRQISKDDNLDSDEDDGALGATGGTFRRASDQVLAERRIVKVRRTPVASSAPNPFADIRLIPSSIPLPTDPILPQLPNPLNSNSALSKPDVEEVVPNTGVSGEVSLVNRSPEQTAILPEAEKNSVEPGVVDEESAGDVSVPNESDVKDEENPPVNTISGVVKRVENTNENGKASGGELVGPTGTSSETFVQLSSAKNAFAGSFGTGFSSSPSIFNSSSTMSSLVSSGFVFGQPFTFGSQSLGSSVSFESGQSQTTFGAKPSLPGAFPSMSSMFGKSNGSGSSQQFGSLNPSTATLSSVQVKSSVVSLQEIPLETGEEKEKAIFTADAALFEFLDGGWKERGKGELKLNVSDEKDKRPRLVMRSKGNYRLLLNANLFPDMKLSKMDNRGISFVCVNSAAEGRTGLTTYAVKLKDVFAESEFTTAVQAHKGSTNSEPRTPESSPKATERPSKAIETSEIEA